MAGSPNIFFPPFHVERRQQLIGGRYLWRNTIKFTKKESSEISSLFELRMNRVSTCRLRAAFVTARHSSVGRAQRRMSVKNVYRPRLTFELSHFEIPLVPL